MCPSTMACSGQHRRLPNDELRGCRKSCHPHLSWDSCSERVSGNNSRARSKRGTISSRDLPPALPDPRAAVRLAGSAARSDNVKETEILGLRHQSGVLQRQVRSPRLTWADRAVLAGLTRRLSTSRRCQLALIVTPRTLLRWHAELVKRHWAYRRRTPGRPRTGPAIRRLALEIARGNPAWGYRICGELTGPGHKIAPSTIWEILQAAGIDPAPQRAPASWNQFLPGQARTIAAVDFFHAGTVFLPRLSVLSDTGHPRRRGDLACITANPAAAGTVQQARNRLMDPGEQTGRPKFLIRDRAAKYTGAFDAVFTATGTRIITTPVQAPRANAICERRIASARRECTDRILITGRQHLHHTLSEYADHYNPHRPHRAPGQRPPGGRSHAAPAGDNIRVRRRDRLGSLIHEYSQVA